MIQNNGRYSYTFTGRTPDQPYEVGWAYKDATGEWQINTLQVVYGDAHGNAMAKGNIPVSALPVIKDVFFSQGAVFVAWQSVDS